VLSSFATRTNDAMVRYESFVREGISPARSPELVSGALLTEKVGSTEFLESLLSEVNERESQTLRLSSKVSHLASLPRRIAIDEGITELELCSGSRGKRASKARRLFCHVAVKRIGHPGAHVARFPGVTISAVVRAANSENLGGIGKYS
jgi:hypothetical protein